MTRPLTGRDVLLWLGLFFGAIIAVNAYYITMSVRTFSGEDEQKPYLQGITYNNTLARRAAQARLGWTAAVTASRVAGGHVRIDVALKDRAGAAPAAVRLVGELRHPADETRDRRLIFNDLGGGRYDADAGTVPAGAWDVLVNGTDDNRPFEATARLWVP